MTKTTTVDLTPTPEQYRKTLRFLIDRSTNKADVAWAKKELARVKGVRQWGKQTK
jgi:hypothetical protein